MLENILACQRDLFEIPPEVTYLNCGFISPLLRAAREAGEAGVARKSRPWEIRPADFFGETEVARELFAALCGGDAEGVAIIPSVSYGMAVAAANLTVAAGQELLVLAEQFPSNVYPWRELARARGAAIVTVPRDEDDDWTRGVLARITERTAVVAVPHCHWTDGTLLDLVQVGARAREVGAALVVDATQSLGAYPFDVAAIQPDFLVVSAYKWLLGPHSLGFMYVAPRHRGGEPLEYGWLNRAESEDFAGLVDYQDGYQPGARRFDVGGRSNPALLPMAIAGMRQLCEWDVPHIAATLERLTRRIEQGALALGLTATPAAHRAGHMIGLGLPQGDPGEVAAKLAADKIFVSLRGCTIRVTPHVYNDDADVERLLEGLSAAHR